MSKNCTNCRCNGLKSDWATMQEATQILDELKVPYHVEVVSAHRTPDKLF